MMNIDLTVLIQAAIALIAALITTRLIPWINAKTTLEQQALLRIAARTCVFAAEQIFGNGYGEDKLDYVKRGLTMRGFDVDLDVIEAAVREMSLELGLSGD